MSEYNQARDEHAKLLHQEAAGLGLAISRTSDGRWLVHRQDGTAVEAGSEERATVLQNELLQAASAEEAHAFNEVLDSRLFAPASNVRVGGTSVAEESGKLVERKATGEVVSVIESGEQLDAVRRQKAGLGIAEEVQINGSNEVFRDEVGRIAQHIAINNSTDQPGIVTGLHEGVEANFKRGLLNGAFTESDVSTALSRVANAIPLAVLERKAARAKSALAQNDTRSALSLRERLEKVTAGTATSDELRETMVELAVMDAIERDANGGRVPWKAGTLRTIIDAQIARETDADTIGKLGKLRAWVNAARTWFHGVFGVVRALQKAKQSGKLKADDEFGSFVDSLLNLEESKFAKAVEREAEAMMGNDATAAGQTFSISSAELRSKIESAPDTTTLGELGITEGFHANKGGLLSPSFEPRVSRQSRRGQHVGFYMAPQASETAQYGSNVAAFAMAPDSLVRVLRRPGEVERITPEKRDELRREGIHLVIGPAIIGSRVEIAALSSEALGNDARAVPADGSRVTVMPDGARLVGPTTFSITAYHGTPHKVDKFTTAKIGTGEGAQAYGWGLYFAESRAVGEGYQRKLSVSNEYARMAIQLKGTRTEALDYMRSDSWDQSNKDVQGAINELLSESFGGNLYTVELLPNEEDFLEWDKPLSEQSENVKALVSRISDSSAMLKPYIEVSSMIFGFSKVVFSEAEANAVADSMKKRGDDNPLVRNITPTGSSLYSYLIGKFRTTQEWDEYPDDPLAQPDPNDQAAQKASKHLVSLGIPGIRYLDGDSRTKGSWIIRFSDGEGYDPFPSKEEAERVVANGQRFGLKSYHNATVEWKEDGDRTYNYVIFDEKLVKILEENGNPANQGGETFSLAGTKAQISQQMRDSLETAKAMAAAGKTSEEIRALTGWFPGKYDGKMRYEVPDEGARLINFDDRNVWAGGKVRNTVQGVNLGDIFDHQRLFESYPALRHIAVSVVVGPGMANEGAFRNRDPRERGKPSFYASGSSGKRALSTLLHEIQHWIQQEEGFARGSSPTAHSEFRNETEAVIKARAEVTAIGQQMRKSGLAGDLKSIQEFARRKASGNITAEERRLSDSYSAANARLTEAIRNSPRVTAVDQYRRTAGEIESRDVQARQNFTPEQRAAIAPYSSENIAKEDAIVMFGGGATFSLSASRLREAMPKRDPIGTLPNVS